MSQPDVTRDRDACLVSDGIFHEALQRLHPQPGMLLGLEAFKAEQAFHRRRMTRHTYWCHGFGTVVGLRVDAKGKTPAHEDEPRTVHLHVTPGVAVDGLGREVTLSEPYCIDLSRWLTTIWEDPEQWAQLLEHATVEADPHLWLKVTLRYQDRPSGLQPVLGTALNAGTDPVQPKLHQDGVLLELKADGAHALPDGALFPTHALPPPFSAVEPQLQPLEQARVAGATGAARQQLELGARLLHTLSDDAHALDRRQSATATPEDHAPILLARIGVRTPWDKPPLVNVLRMEVDNLARPFLFNPSVLASLLRA